MTPDFEVDPRLWTEATERVEGYLRSYRVDNRLLLHRLTQHIIGRAARRLADEPGREPTALAIEEARRLIEAWLERVVGAADGESAAQRFARGRAAVELANLATAWPEYFLDYREAPPEMTARLRSTYLDAGPDLEFSNMAPRPLDLGPITSAAGSAWRTFDKWPLLGSLAVWILFTAVLAVGFYATRY